jgi:hypothetical protein
MPLDEQSKQVLRERLKIAREAKEAKKSKVAQAIKEAVPSTPQEPVLSKPVVMPQPSVPSPPELVLPPPVVDATAPRDAPITAKVAKSARKSEVVEEKVKQVKPVKTKYAKLVFYQEPSSNKKIKKLAKVLEQSSDSDSEDKDFAHVEPKTQPTMDRQLQYNRISHLSKSFFD